MFQVHFIFHDFKRIFQGVHECYGFFLLKITEMFQSACSTGIFFLICFDAIESLLEKDGHLDTIYSHVSVNYNVHTYNVDSKCW